MLFVSQHIQILIPLPKAVSLAQSSVSPRAHSRWHGRLSCETKDVLPVIQLSDPGTTPSSAQLSPILPRGGNSPFTRSSSMWYVVCLILAGLCKYK